MATNITEMDATDLVGRLVTNKNGAEFYVKRLSFDAEQSCVIIWVQSVDDFDSEQGLIGLAGWSIHQKIK